MPLHQPPLEESSKCPLLSWILLPSIFCEASIFRVGLFRRFVGWEGAARGLPDGETAPGDGAGEGTEGEGW